MTMKNQFRSGIVLVSMVAVTGIASAALYGYGPAETWTIRGIAQMTTSVASSISSFGATFGVNMATKFEMLISAIAVATKQEAVSAGVVADATRQSAEQLVNAVRAQRQADQVAEAFISYNPGTGQGHQPCLVNAKNRTLDGAFDKIGLAARASVAALDVAPGRMVDSTAAVMGKRLETHRALFCSEAEVKAGICSASQLPGGDTNAALLFESTEAGSLKDKAQIAYIQHVLGTPDQRLTKDAGQSAAGQTFMLAKANKDALLSIPAFSLSMIRAANLQSAELGGKSPNDVLRLRVNQYFGGAEAQAWAKTLTAQSERGLMVEAVKMDGLAVWMRHQRFKQGQRLEANLAAAALSAAEEAKAGVNANYIKLARESASVEVK